jgi:hypothetical protein
MFEGLKSIFNTQKVHLKKNNCLLKKIKNAFKNLKNLKMAKKKKNIFDKSLRIKFLSKNIF